MTLKEVIVDDRVLMVSICTTPEKEGKTLAFWINEEKTSINGQHHLAYESIHSRGFNYSTEEIEPTMVLVRTYENQILPEGEANR